MVREWHTVTMDVSHPVHEATDTDTCAKTPGNSKEKAKGGSSASKTPKASSEKTPKAPSEKTAKAQPVERSDEKTQKLLDAGWQKQTRATAGHYQYIAPDGNVFTSTSAATAYAQVSSSLRPHTLVA
jgi:hypothetical protein